MSVETKTQDAGSGTQQSMEVAGQSELIKWKAEAERSSARVAELEALVHKVNDEAAKRRIAEKEARDKAEAEARAKGEHEKLIKTLEEKLGGAEKELSRLSAYEEPARRWRSHEEEQLRVVSARSAQMPEHWSKLVAGATTLELKMAVLAAFDEEAKARASLQEQKQTDQKRAAPPAPAGGAPAAAPPAATINAALASPTELARLKSENEAAYYEAIGGKDAASKKKSGFMGTLFGN